MVLFDSVVTGGVLSFTILYKLYIFDVVKGVLKYTTLHTPPLIPPSVPIVKLSNVI